MATFVQAGDLDQRVQILRFYEETPGVWVWAKDALSWAHIEPDSRKNLFSDNGIGTRGAILTMRHNRHLAPGGMLRWKEQALYLTEIVPLSDAPGYDSIRAAVVQLTDCRAQPQKRTGRDDLNRPVAIEQMPITFRGILAEEYHRNESDDVYRVDTQRRVLVTPPEILLSPGDLVDTGDSAPYVIRTRADLDSCKTEYLMEREVDV